MVSLGDESDAWIGRWMRFVQAERNVVIADFYSRISNFIKIASIARDALTARSMEPPKARPACMQFCGGWHVVRTEYRRIYADCRQFISKFRPRANFALPHFFSLYIFVSGDQSVACRHARCA
jgi:hypothetical protein